MRKDSKQQVNCVAGWLAGLVAGWLSVHERAEEAVRSRRLLLGYDQTTRRPWTTTVMLDLLGVDHGRASDDKRR